MPKPQQTASLGSPEPERVVRDFLDAVTLLQPPRKPAAPVSSAHSDPGESRTAGDVSPDRSDIPRQSRIDHELTASEQVAPDEEDYSGVVYCKMAENIRRDSLRRLLQSDQRAGVVRRRARGALIPFAIGVAAGLIAWGRMAPAALSPIRQIHWGEVFEFACALLPVVALALYARRSIAMLRFKVMPRRRIFHWHLRGA